MKMLSNFLSQDGIVLKELHLSLKKWNTTFQYQTGNNYFRDKGVHLFEALKKNKSVKKLNLDCISTHKITLMIIFKIVKLLLKEWNQFPVFFPMMESFLKNWIWVWKKKKNFLTPNRLQQIWRWGLCSSCWRIEKEQVIEKIDYFLYFSSHFFVDHF